MTTEDELAEKARHSRTKSAGWMIQVLAGLLNRDMQARLDVVGLKLEHFILMMMLAEQDNQTQTDLGKRVNLKNYAVSRALDALEDLEFVERRPDAKSRRAHRVFLTAKGRGLMPELFETVAGINDTLLVALGSDERGAFLASLTKLVAANRPAIG